MHRFRGTMARRLTSLLAVAFLGSATGATVAMTPHGHMLNENEVDDAFRNYITKHRRHYKHGTQEFSMRQVLFKDRMRAVHAHNSKPGGLWKAAPSHFSDRTEAERKAVLGYRKRIRPSRGGGASLLERSVSYSNHSVRELPMEKNWMHLNKAHNVRDQGSCGSCWAIATISVLEAHYEIYKPQHAADRTFSAQQTVDCTPNPRECGGKGGCQGATVELGMDWIVKNGLSTEEADPYTAQDGTCSVGERKILANGGGGGGAFGLMAYKTLEPNKDAPLAEAVANVGPVAVSASAGAWFEYNSGVFDGCDKDTVVDHAITLYGYGEDDGKKYWLIRNSWGPEWGEKGFIRLLRHDHGVTHCGTDNDNQEGTGCKDDPKEVEVCGMCGVLFDSVVPYFNGSPGHGGASTPDFTEAMVSSADSTATGDDSLIVEDEGRASNMRSHVQTSGEFASINSNDREADSRAGSLVRSE